MDREKGFLERIHMPRLALAAVLVLGAVACHQDGPEEGTGPTTTDTDDIEVTENTGNMPYPTRGPEAADEAEQLCGDGPGLVDEVEFMEGTDVPLEGASALIVVDALRNPADEVDGDPDIVWSGAELSVSSYIRMGRVIDKVVVRYQDPETGEGWRGFSLTDEDGDEHCEVAAAWRPGGEVELGADVSEELAELLERSLY